MNQPSTNPSENPTTKLPTVSELSYEQARDQLVKVIEQMEGGQLPLEQTLQVWERAEELANHCQNILDQAKARVTQARAHTVVETDSTTDPA